VSAKYPPSPKPVVTRTFVSSVENEKEIDILTACYYKKEESSYKLVRAFVQP